MSISIGDYLLARFRRWEFATCLGSRRLQPLVPGASDQKWFNQLRWMCNELNAAYAADGCSRLVGISALATTYGVGELASLSGVAGAYAERVPIVWITGTPPLPSIRERALLHHTLADGNYEIC